MEQNSLESFKNLSVWRKAVDLAILTYSLTEKFPRPELYGLVNQMRRAVISISSNIAEGFKSNHKKEKLQFYNVAYSSAAELESQTEVAYKLNFLKENDYQRLIYCMIEINKMIDGLIKAVNKNFPKSYILNSIFFILFLYSIFYILYPILAFASSVDGTIDATYKYAWSENAGWINFGSSQGNVHVTDSALSGYAWGENAGWISLNCSNTNSCGTVNYKVSNDGNGTLSGYAWGENVGWINFAPTYGGVTINSSGAFSGYAWGENVGWIVFNCSTTNSCATVDYSVRTDWRPSSSRVAPNTPTLVSPSDNALTTVLRPSFVATFSNPMGETGRINFQVALDSSFNTIMASGTASGISDEANASWSPSNNLGSAVYYWRAQGEDNYGGTSSWSNYRVFTISTGGGSSAPMTPASASATSTQVISTSTTIISTSTPAIISTSTAVMHIIQPSIPSGEKPAMQKPSPIPVSSSLTSFGKHLGFKDRSSEIKILQQFLNTQGFQIADKGLGSSGQETDYFGVLTQKAVQKFQDKYNIAKKGDPGYGEVGPKTRAKINEIISNIQPSAVTPTTPPPTSTLMQPPATIEIPSLPAALISYQLPRNLYSGMIGEDVRHLQEFLKAQGPAIYSEGLVTGYFGLLTQEAVKRFQVQHNLPSVGYVGPKTRAKINQLLLR